MSTFLRAHIVTTVLPNPLYTNSGKTEAKIQLKRKSTGDVVNYTKPSDRVELTQTWVITRSKAEELKRFVLLYHTIPWEIEFEHDGSKWSANLIGEPIRHRTNGRGVLANEDSITISMTFSAKKLT